MVFGYETLPKALTDFHNDKVDDVKDETKYPNSGDLDDVSGDVFCPYMARPVSNRNYDFV